MGWLVVACIALGCGGPPRKQTLSASWSAPPLLAHVPDDSPYVLAALGPSGATPAKLLANLERELAEVFDDTADLTVEERAQLEPGLRAALVVLDELRDKPARSWFAALGLSPDLDMVVYAHSIWPVARMPIANPGKLRDILDRAMRAGDLPVAQRRFGNGTYWPLELGKSTLVVAIDDRRSHAIATIVPPELVAEILPHILGDKLPERSLATTRRVPDLLAKHALPRLSFAYLDQMLLLAAFDRPPTALDRPWRDKLPAMTRACRDDVGRLAAAVPRIIAGYRRSDDATFDMSLVIEVPASASTALARMRTTVPALPKFRVRPMFAASAAIDGDLLIAWVRDLAKAWLARGERCEWFGPFDQSFEALATALANPMVVLHGLRGGTLVVDDYSTSPPKLEGDLLLVGSNVHELPKLIGTVIPTFAGLATGVDGKPIAIPTQQLGLPWPAHLGAKGDRLAVAAGRASESRVSERLAAPATRAPLLAFESDLAKFYAMRGRTEPDKPPRERSFDDVSIRLEVREGALELVVTGLWTRPTASTR